MYVLATPPVNPKYVESYFYRVKDGKTQVFTFKTAEIANKCLQMFEQWASEMLMQRGEIIGLPQVMSFVSQIQLKEVPSGFTCDLIDFEDILREKGL